MHPPVGAYHVEHCSKRSALHEGRWSSRCSIDSRRGNSFAPAGSWQLPETLLAQASDAFQELVGDGDESIGGLPVCLFCRCLLARQKWLDYRRPSTHTSLIVHSLAQSRTKLRRKCADDRREFRGRGGHGVCEERSATVAEHRLQAKLLRREKWCEPFECVVQRIGDRALEVFEPLPGLFR